MLKQKLPFWIRLKGALSRDFRFFMGRGQTIQSDPLTKRHTRFRKKLTKTVCPFNNSTATYFTYCIYRQVNQYIRYTRCSTIYCNDVTIYEKYIYINVKRCMSVSLMTGRTLCLCIVVDFADMCPRTEHCAKHPCLRRQE